MFFGDTVQQTREMFFSSWHKYKQNKDLLPLEQQIVQVILDHPEYQSKVENINYSQQSYYPELGETNPFLHMGLHLAIREQISTNRPQGIRSVYKKLLKKYADLMKVEHIIMEQLAECLWISQKNNTPPDETHYLKILSNL
jgi:hypothetical protein